MNWLTIINTVFSYGWLIAILVLAILAYRAGQERTRHVARMEKLLTDVMQANAHAAVSAAESARQAVEVVHNVVALLAKEPKT